MSALTLAAQSEADRVAARERARVKAGQDIAPLYLPSYFGIGADGDTINFEALTSQDHPAVVRLDDPFSVRVSRTAAVVNGIQWTGASPDPQRFLRVWVNLGDAWRLAVEQLTAIRAEPVGNSADRSVVGPVRASNPPCHLPGALEADRRLDDAADRGDRADYASLTAPEFWHVDSAGRLFGRDEFLAALFSDGRPIETVEKGRSFKSCNLALFTSRRNGGRELTVRIMAVVDGIWQQVASQRTPVRRE
jgi:hypothetical protein